MTMRRLGAHTLPDVGQPELRGRRLHLSSNPRFGVQILRYAF